jgi:phosphatidylserine/phosphatidylglycerophosphate/cardiolipin synthase-like enzyme
MGLSKKKTINTLSVLVTFVVVIAAAGCASKKPAVDTERAPANAVADGASKYTQLQLLGRNADAFASKRQLISGVQPRGTIDMSYFILGNDPTSAVLMNDLIDKADMGATVRILADFFMTSRQVPWLLLLNNHPRIEVKRFRPPTQALIDGLEKQKIKSNLFLRGLMEQDKELLLRSAKESPLLKSIESVIKSAAALEGKKPDADYRYLKSISFPLVYKFARRFGELAPLVVELRNFLKRTHHKLLVVDQHCFVMGGRNVSDEYHADPGDRLLAHRSYPFQDTDIRGCTAGNEQQESFDRLWNSPLSAPLDARPPGSAHGFKAVTRESLQLKARDADHLAVHSISSAAINLQDTEARLFENLPAGVVGSKPQGHHGITSAYIERINHAKFRIDLVSAYFCVSGANKDPRLNELYHALANAAGRGVQVGIYTNSITTTDLSMVNLVGYLQYRELIERKNIKIFELAPGQGSLHTKAAAFDDNYVMIGSFNLDPRSHGYDTNNLLELHDLSSSDELTVAFRTSRIESLRWNELKPSRIGEHGPLERIDDILREHARDVTLFRAVREAI